MVEKYRALRIIATLLKVLAWIALILGVLLAIFMVIAAIVGAGRLGRPTGLEPYSYYYRLWGFSTLGGIVAAAFTAIGGVLNFLCLYAVSEMIQLQLDIEQNTRETAYYLRPK